MEIFVTILIAAVVFTLKTVLNIDEPDTTTKGNRVPRRIVGEPFPAVEPLGEEPVAVEQSAKVEQLLTALQGAKRQPAPKRVSKAQRVTATLETPVEEEKKENPYALKDKSDIKKAIIYSEIFNRKYN